MTPIYESFNLTPRQWLEMPWDERGVLCRRVMGDAKRSTQAFQDTNAACMRAMATVDPLAAILANEPWRIYAYESILKAGGCAAWRSFNPQIKRQYFDRWADGTGVEWDDRQAATIEHLADMGCARVSR